MTARLLRIILKPRTAFGSPLTGDTLFGQLCWGLRLKLGAARLEELLEGYGQGRPFAVLSDAFPRGFLPLPTWPSAFWASPAKEELRKKLKAKRWLPLEALNKKPELWQEAALDDEAAYAQGAEAPDSEAPLSETRYQPVIRSQPHNSLSRLTGATGEGRFAPYTQIQTWFHPATRLDLYAILPEERLETELFLKILEEIGAAGYGRDASQGLGKFEVPSGPEAPPWAQTPASRFLTLASSAPQGQGYDPEGSFYQVRTHFGRHGLAGAVGPNPFKRPLLLAKTGAVFALREKAAHFWLGQGLTGVSPDDPQAVHQGYAPVVPWPDRPASANEAAL